MMFSFGVPPSRGGFQSCRLAGIGRLSLLALLASSAACSDAGSMPLTQEDPSGIILSLDELNLAAGDTARIRAVIVNSSGAPIASPSAGAAKVTTPRITWQSSNPVVADVSQSGLVLAKQSGSTVLTASSGNLKRQSTVKVTGASRTVVVSPRLDTLAVAETKQFSASVLNNGGNPTGDDVEWESTNEAVASVDQFGSVVARAIGVALIVVQGGGGADTATVVVEAAQQATSPTALTVASVTLTPSSAEIPVGLSAQFTASVRDADNNIVTGKTVTWSSSNTAVATVNTSGVVTAKASGLANVVATVDGVQGKAAVAVPKQSAGSGSGAARPNEPSGFTRWAEHDFSCIPGASGCSLVAGHASNSLDSNYSIVNDGSAPNGIGRALRIRYPDGLKDGSSPGRFFVRDQSSSSAATPLREWYVSMWILLEGSDWETPPANLKLWYNGIGKMGEANKGGSIHLNRGGGANTLASAYGTRFTARPCPTCTIKNYSDNLVGDQKVYEVGRWHHVEFYGSLSTPGREDGVYRMWVDGRLVNERLNVQNQHPDDWTTGFYEFHWAPVWGGACSSGCPKVRDDHMRLAHLYISGIRQ
jgi:uncharacterized protein YjdB